MNPKNSLSRKPTKITKITKRYSSPLIPPLSLVKYIVLGSLSAVVLCVGGDLHAQTTLSGDHIITGDLNVGTSGTTGNVLVTGDIGGSAAPGLKVTGDGGVVFTGSFGVGQIPTEAAGTRFMWFPKKAALRVGSFDSSSSYEHEIGNHSTALGLNSYAGDNSYTFGNGGQAWNGSFSFGVSSMSEQDAFAFGNGSFSIFGSMCAGDGASASNDSLALGAASSASDTSLALGVFSSAYAESVAVGYFSSASNGGVAIGNGSSGVNGGVAIGDLSYAVGNRSFALFGSAYRNESIAMGSYVEAYSKNEVVFGRFNKEEGDSSSWVETEPLFVVANGTGNSEDPAEVRFRNAFIIYKNGDMKVTKRQGDILMGEFGNPE